MPDATFISTNHVQNIKIHRFTIPGVALNTVTAEYGLAVPRKGLLWQVGIVCPTSLDFDFSLRSKAGVTYPDLDVILQDDTINKEYREYVFGIPYFNNDAVQIDKLYIIIDNEDMANATGIIQVELGVCFSFVGLS